MPHNARKSCYYRQKLFGSWVPKDLVCPQEKMVNVMAELKGHMLIRVICHVMWCKLQFNKSSEFNIILNGYVKIVHSFIEFCSQFYCYCHGNVRLCRFYRNYICRCIKIVLSLHLSQISSPLHFQIPGCATRLLW